MTPRKEGKEGRKQRAALTSESREGGDEGGGREGTVGPGQSGPAVDIKTCRSREEEDEDEDEDEDEEEEEC